MHNVPFYPSLVKVLFNGTRSAGKSLSLLLMYHDCFCINKFSFDLAALPSYCVSEGDESGASECSMSCSRRNERDSDLHSGNRVLHKPEMFSIVQSQAWSEDKWIHTENASRNGRKSLFRNLDLFKVPKLCQMEEPQLASFFYCCSLP